MFRGIMLAIFMFLVLVISFNVLAIILTPVRTVTNVIEKTLDADNVIYNYEWFKKQKADLIAFKQKINTLETSILSYETSMKDVPRKDWTFEQNQRSNDLNAQLIGLQNQRADMVAEYNARSKMANRNFVKFDADIPEHIDEGSF